MGDWIVNLIEDYKYVDGVHFGERKHWLHDDYVKFIRLSESLIEKNGEGILGFITNHGYLDNPTFRGMRWHLMQTFDKIYVLDLHGNAKKTANSPDGSPDKNVFDIQQGVGIIIAVKLKNKDKKIRKKKAKVIHGELWGTRASKYEALFENSRNELVHTEFEPSKPLFSFVPTSGDARVKYEAGFQIAELFQVGTMGVQTSRDKFAVGFSREEIVERLRHFTDKQYSDVQIRNKFFGSKKEGKYLPGDSRGWQLSEARKKIDVEKNSDLVIPLNYRLFDKRYTYFSGNLIDWPREKVMRHFLKGENLSLLFPRQLAAAPYHHIFVTNMIAEMCVISNKTKEQNAVYPLYLYPDEQDLDQTRRINFDPKVWKKLQELARDKKRGSPDEIVTFDYIYGVLHCPDYRSYYVEFLKNDFPRIPWPSSPESFWDVAEKGGKLRRLHLMESDAIGATPFPFKGEGNGQVEKPLFQDGKVWINDAQFFDLVPLIAWEFHIGGYQPAQKWLKDRKGSELSFDDIKQYQRIIKILAETDRIMKTIDMLI
jgi:predicted helicase